MTILEGTIKGISGKRLHEDHSDQEKFGVSFYPLNVELPNSLFNNKDAVVQL